MGTLVVSWGIVMTLTGVVKNFGGLLATRFLLGVFEAGFFPGAIWIVSQWYPPHKTQSRMAMFYLSSALSGAFSGLLAAGIAQMRGVGGYEGWRWIFLLEGILSVVVGVSCFFLLPDSPGTASWLKPDESRFLELMHISSRGAKTTHDGEKDKKHHWKTLWQVLSDKQLYLQALVFASNSVPNYGLKFTMPQVNTSMCILAATTADQFITDHPQHGLHVHASPAPDRTAIHLRRHRSSPQRVLRRPRDMAHALHSRLAKHSGHRLLRPLRLRSTHRRERAPLLHHGLLRLHRRIPNPARLQRMDYQ
jgi:hypothetical protein